MCMSDWRWTWKESLMVDMWKIISIPVSLSPQWRTTLINNNTKQDKIHKKACVFQTKLSIITHALLYTCLASKFGTQMIVVLKTHRLMLAIYVTSRILILIIIHIETWREHLIKWHACCASIIKTTGKAQQANIKHI